MIVAPFWWSTTAMFAAINIPVQRTPAITKAVILVAVPFPGALPTETESQITREIEDALQRLNDVDFIASTSMRGSSITQVIFLDGVDADRRAAKSRIWWTRCAASCRISFARSSRS